jgi:hypothetical protein
MDPRRRENMQRILTGFVAAAWMAVVPTLALADNQEAADQIAQKLRQSGQLQGYSIGVKYDGGTAWLRGRVSDEEQMATAVRLVFQSPGVTRVVNELTVASADTAGRAAPGEPSSVSQADGEQQGPQTAVSIRNPLRNRDLGSAAEQAQSAQKSSLVSRLEAIIGNGPEQNAPAHADRVSAEFNPAPVRKVSAEESPELAPARMTTPQRARAMNAARMAMAQPMAQGPVAPNGGPMPMYSGNARAGVAASRYDQPCMPNYAWPSYAAYPNYAAVTYPKQYSPTAWPYIGPFYPYPQVPLGWRKVTLEWDSGWWFLDFKDQPASCWRR